MTQQTAQQTTRLDFLFEAGYSMLSTCPELSRFYINEFQNTLTEYELIVPTQIQRSICTRCGQIQVSGLTQKVRLVKKTKLLNICLTCQEQKKYHGTLKHKKNIPKNTQQASTAFTHNKNQQEIAQKDHKQSHLIQKHSHSNQKSSSITQKQPISRTASNPPGIQSQSPIQKKKNKGKKNNLQALLNKQQQNQKSSSNNSLNDFLSSL